MSYQGILAHWRRCVRARRAGHTIGCLLLAGLALSGHNALAWNAAGHRLSAAIAWTEMTPSTREKIEALLAVHPAQGDWLQRLGRGTRPSQSASAADGRARFAEASTWADDIRRDERFSDQAPDAGAKNDDETARHRDWHYLNWLIDGTVSGPPSHLGGQLDRALERQSRRLADPSLSPQARAQALVWLVHLLADAHQPLHVASWRAADGSIDAGGLAFKVHDDAKPRFAETSLHSWWDDLPGPPWLRGEHLIERAAILLNVYPAAQVRQGSFSDWLSESFALAQNSVRPSVSEPGQPWPVTAEYRTLAKKISERRLVEAGVRLGRLLNTALKD